LLDIERYRHCVNDSLHRDPVRRRGANFGDWTVLSRKQRRTLHQPRLRRDAYGELLQIVGRSIAGSTIVEHDAW
jgi:hypothetical protein